MEWHLSRRIILFIASFVLSLIVVDYIFSFPLLRDTSSNISSFLTYGLAAFATAFFLRKKSPVPKNALNTISLQFAVVALIIPFVSGALILVIGQLLGWGLYTRVFSAWEQAGTVAVTVRLMNQIANAAIVFMITRLTL